MLVELQAGSAVGSTIVAPNWSRSFGMVLILILILKFELEFKTKIKVQLRARLRVRKNWRYFLSTCSQAEQVGVTLRVKLNALLSSVYFELCQTKLGFREL